MSEQQFRLKDEQIKLVRLIERVDSSAGRVDNLAKQFNIYGCRMIVIETNISEIEYEIDNIKKNKATVEQLKELETKTKQKL